MNHYLNIWEWWSGKPSSYWYWARILYWDHCWHCVINVVINSASYLYTSQYLIEDFHATSGLHILDEEIILWNGIFTEVHLEQNHQYLSHRHYWNFIRITLDQHETYPDIFVRSKLMRGEIRSLEKPYVQWFGILISFLSGLKLSSLGVPLPQSTTKLTKYRHMSASVPFVPALPTSSLTRRKIVDSFCFEQTSHGTNKLGQVSLFSCRFY